MLMAICTGCGGGGGAIAPATPTPSVLFRGTVTDSIGDAFADEKVPGDSTPPTDLAAASIEITSSTLVATVSLAPGTLTRNLPFQSLLQVGLDTDENLSTGCCSVVNGVNYLISTIVLRSQETPDSAPPTADIRAYLYQLWPAGVTRLAEVQVSFPAADQVQFTVPLNLINDDGRMAFTVISANWPVARTVDYMPNSGLPYGLVR
jgi:hypothetical protein